MIIFSPDRFPQLLLFSENLKDKNIKIFCKKKSYFQGRKVCSVVRNSKCSLLWMGSYFSLLLLKSYFVSIFTV